MTRSQEILLQRSARLCAAALIAASLYLLFAPVERSSETLDISQLPGQRRSLPAVTGTPDPELEKLAVTRFTRKVAPKQQVVVKPPAPELCTLVRLRGIMSYGDAKDNEAIIETLKDNQTRTYKTGEKLANIEAVVKQVDTSVLFSYDGKDVRIGIQSERTSSSGSIAHPSGEAPYVGTK